MHSFHVVVPVEDEELAADRLWQLGVEAVGIGDALDGTVELWTSVGEHASSVQRAVDALEDRWTWRLEQVVEPQTTWRDHVVPTWYDPCGVVVPAWQSVEASDGVLVTSIEPASSFGLGDHPTTVATLSVLVDRMRSREVSTVLDVGCGSGVLGIVAAQLGATVRATDVSAAAIEATLANAERNGVGAALTADTSALDSLDGPYELVVANILAPVLVVLAPDLRRLVAAGGGLLVSGILAGGHDHVLDALAPLRPVRTHVRDGWASVMLE